MHIFLKHWQCTQKKKNSKEKGLNQISALGKYTSCISPIRRIFLVYNLNKECLFTSDLLF